MAVQSPRANGRVTRRIATQPMFLVLLRTKLGDKVLTEIVSQPMNATDANKAIDILGRTITTAHEILWADANKLVWNVASI